MSCGALFSVERGVANIEKLCYVINLSPVFDKIKLIKHHKCLGPKMVPTVYISKISKYVILMNDQIFTEIL